MYCAISTCLPSDEGLLRMDKNKRERKENVKLGSMEIDWSVEQKDAEAELAALKRQQESRDAEPFLFCKVVTRWPVQSFFVAFPLASLLVCLYGFYADFNIFLVSSRRSVYITGFPGFLTSNYQFLLLALFGHVSMIGISGILHLSGYDIFPLFLDDVPLRLVDEPWDARWFAWNDRNKYDAYCNRRGSNAGFRTSEEWYSTVDLYFEHPDNGNVLTKDSLIKMKQLESELMGTKNYDTFCKLDVQTRKCVKPLSVLRYFDGTFSSVHPVFNDSSFNNVKSVLYEAYKNEATRDGFTFFLAKTYNVSQEEVITPLTRSYLPFGQPHELYSIAKYKTEAEKFSGENINPVIEKYENIKEFMLSYRSEALWMYTARNQAKKDVLWAGASMAFIFIAILSHTRSLWIAGLAIFSIFASFCTGNLLYNVVFRFRYLGYFHILALFIILGIGADDVFVFYDIWRNTGTEEYLSVAHRLSDCYKKSAFSMFFTSLTTAVAFLSSAISPLLITRSFGVFSALVVVVNFVSIIIYFPTVVVMYHLYFEMATWPCCYPCLSQKEKVSSKNRDRANKRNSPDGDLDNSVKQTINDEKLAKINPVNEAFDYVNGRPHWSSHFPNYAFKIDRPKLFPSDEPVYKSYELDGKKTENISNKTGAYNYGASPETPKNLKGTRQPYRSTNVDGFNSENHPNKNGTFTSTHKKPKKKSPFVRFFRNYYFRFVTNKYARWVIILVHAGVLGFFIYQASKIEPDNELFNVLPYDHPLMKAYRFKLHGFVTSYGHALMSIYFLFGIKPNDLSGCHFSEPVCIGRQRWDPIFNPNTVQAQIALMDFCETLRTIPEKKAEELRIQRHPVTGEYNVNCFMDKLKAFLQEETQLTGTNWSLPFTKEMAIDFAAARPQFFNTSVYNDAFNNSLQIAISYWLTNRYSGDYSNDFNTYDPLIGEEVGPFSSKITADADIMYGNNLKFVAVTVGTTIQALLLGYTDGDAIMEGWEEFLNKQLDKMPVELKTGFQMSSHERWVWITRQRLLVENALYGIVIGLSLALVILIVATGNIIMGLLATLSLCCCTVCVVGVIVVGGWKLGMIEAMNMCMVVGLSVDYVVHLAEGYTLSLHHDRLSRVRDMLDLMAVSVFFGAFTTLGASLFMLFTVISFFTQFGTFLFSTIGFSLLFSMGLFTTLLGIIGPEGDTGNVIALCERIKCFNSKQQHTNDQNRNR